MNDFGPDAVVLSGVHMLEGEADEFRSSRLNDFVDMLKAIPKHTPIHFELASMASVDFVGEIVKKVEPLRIRIRLSNVNITTKPYRCRIVTRSSLA